MGAPLVIVPAAAISLFFGDKRESSPEPDKKALSILARGMGIVATASGLKSLVAEPSRINLAAAIYQEALCVVFHLCNRFTDKWKEAGCKMDRNTAMIAGCTVAIALQGSALACDICEDEDDEVPAASK